MKTKAPTLKQVSMVLHALARIEYWDGHHESIEEAIDGGWLTIDVNERSMPMPSTKLLTEVKLFVKLH
jgi:hypothetical protein